MAAHAPRDASTTRASIDTSVATPTMRRARGQNVTGAKTTSHAWLIMHRAVSTTRLRSLTQMSLAHINNIYSDMSGDVDASLRPLT